MYNGGHLRVTHRGQLTSGGVGNGAGVSSCMAGASPDRPNLFGSPSFPTPLDRVRSAKRERTAQLQLGACCASPPTPQVWLRRTLSNDSEQSGGQSGVRSGPGLLGSPLRHVASALASRVERVLPGSPQRAKRAAATRSSEGERASGGRSEEEEVEEEEGVRRSGVHCALEDFTGSGINDVSFSAVAPPGLASLLLDGSQTLGESWALYDYCQHAAARLCPASTVRNPNKALCTIDARTSEILTANEMAVALFAVSEDQLVGRRLSEFVKLKYKDTQVTETHIERNSGRLVEVSGRVLECIDSTGLHIPVSVWLTHLSANRDKKEPALKCHGVKCLVALEPVERLTAMLLLAPPASRARRKEREQVEVRQEEEEEEEREEEGWRVLSCDQQALGLFECCAANELVGKPLEQFITGFEEIASRTRRPGNAHKKVKLSITGRTRLGRPFPCFAIVQRKSTAELSTQSDVPAYAQLLANLGDGTETVDSENGPWLLTLWLFANISGLLTVRPVDGCIHSCNDTLAQMLFGYSKSALVGRPITEVIPNFFCPEADAVENDRRRAEMEEREDEEEEDDDIQLPPIDESDVAKPNDSQQNTSNLLVEARALLADLSLGASSTQDTAEGRDNSASLESSDSAAVDSAIESDPEFTPNAQVTESTPMKSGTSTMKADIDVRLVAPAPSPPSIREGSFEGRGRHLDGSALELIYAVRLVELLEAGDRLAVVWVSRNPERQNFAPAFSMSTSSPFWSREVSREPGHLMDSLGAFSGDFSRGAFVDRSWSYLSACSRASLSPAPHGLPAGPVFRSAPAASIAEEAEAEEAEAASRESNGSNGEAPAEVVGIDPSGQPTDPLERDYEPLGVIGKGAFGFVRLARCRRSHTEVVVKHIKKSKLGDAAQFAPDPTCPARSIPREAALLLALDHPNIVTVLACVEGREFWHLVMPKHGQGMDLFEFIDRSPQLDEPLVSYIFRQLVSAVHYLHRRGLVHRDIKDENIILDTQFNIKLIDFGAAARLEPGKMFRVFCGTLEFCSPEILLGNEYRGPEADVWSMGITLYTLMFGENPFFDHEETLLGVLKPPFRVSAKLLDLLSIMLATDPVVRADVATVRVHPWVTQFVDIEKYSFQTVLPNSEFVGNTGSDFRQYSNEGHPGPPPPAPLPQPSLTLKTRREVLAARSKSDSGTAIL